MTISESIYFIDNSTCTEIKSLLYDNSTYIDIKSRLYNAKDVSPLDTLHLASSEAEAWHIAQIVENNAEEGTLAEDTRQALEHRDTDCKWICQVDASWKKKKRRNRARLYPLRRPTSEVTWR
ncbi:hypothetical protein Rs2_29567 [Raphanus sativus]|nr:hypothetical protein Rs2_29567 [Raphanus sativus]